MHSNSPVYLCMHAHVVCCFILTVPVLKFLLLVINVSLDLVRMYVFVYRTDSRWIPPLGCMAFFCMETYIPCAQIVSLVFQSGFVGLLAKNLLSEVLLSCYWWLRDVVNSMQHCIGYLTVNYSAASIIWAPLSASRTLPYRVSEMYVRITEMPCL